MKLVLGDIRKNRGDWSLRADGSFSPGIHLVSGRVGSGKTTLAQVAAGILPPDSGTVSLEGISSKTLSFQHPEYHITGATLADEARSYGVDPDGVLFRAGLNGHGGRDPFSLSRGELKRFHLACLLHRPHDLLILDEPFSALDCREKRVQCRSIEAAREGIVIIFTHEQQVFPRVDFLWELREGTLVSLGRVPEAFISWENCPEALSLLLEIGIVPDNLGETDLLEAVCRTRG